MYPNASYRLLLLLKGIVTQSVDIAGNLHMVQNFTFFTDTCRSATAKI